MKLFSSAVHKFGVFRYSFIIRRTASSSTSSASLHQATMYALRRNAIAGDKTTKLGPVRQATHGDPTGNHSSGQADSDGRRRLYPSALFYMVSAAASALTYLMLLYMEKKLKDLGQHGETAVNLDQFLEKFLAAGEVRGILYLQRQRLAVAQLQSGAVVDGNTFPHRYVFVDFAVPHASASEFRRRIGEAEDELGIALADRVPISEHRLINNVELAILFVVTDIIVFLLIRRFGSPRLIRDLCREHPSRK